MTRKNNDTDLFEVDWAEHKSEMRMERLIENGVAVERHFEELTELAEELAKLLVEEGETL